MRGRWRWLLLPPLVLLSGCAGTPQSREAGPTTVVSVLGAEVDRGGLRLWAAAEGRGGEPPFVGDSRGAAPAAAVEELTNRGEQVVSCAHVEHWLLSPTAAERLPELLSYAFQEPQQSTETQLWVVRDLQESFSAEGDLAKRMTVLKAQGKHRQGFCPVTLRQAAAALAQGKPLLLPALRTGEGGVAFDGFALYQGGRICAWLTGQQALGAALLRGDRIHWTAGGTGTALLLQSTGCRVEPRWAGKTLAGLSLRCRVEGVPTGGWAGDGQETADLEQETARAMGQALRTFQQAGWDGADLLGRAGLAQPLCWDRLHGQRREAFPELPVEIAVGVTVLSHR